MSIMWKYLDKRSATIAAIKDYDAMQFILSSTGDEIKRTYEKMTGIGSPNYDGMPKACNPQAAEDRIIKNIDEIDIIKERYRQAVEYMDWFKPAWEETSTRSISSRNATGRQLSTWTGSNLHGKNSRMRSGTALRPFMVTAIPTEAAQRIMSQST